MSKYPYVIWYDKCVTYLMNYYDCRIVPPNQIDDNQNDGIKIIFNKLDINVFVSNYIMSQIYENKMQYLMYKDLTKYIENIIISALKK